MPRKTQILLCRIGLVALCLLPTALVAGWIVSRNVYGFYAAQASEWERELSNRLGVVVELAGVTYPAPHQARLNGVRFSEQETGQLIAALASVDIDQVDGGWSVMLDGLVIEAGALPSVLQSIESRLLRGRQPVVVHWQARDVVVRETTLRGAPGQSFATLSGTFFASDRASELAMLLTPADAPSAEPIRLTVRRTRNAEPPVTEWQLDTAGHALPCALAVAAFPALARLGPEADFRGSGRANPSDAGISGEWSGDLRRVDLDSLVTQHFPHPMSGLATIAVQRAALAHGKLTEFRGQIHAVDGTVSQSLLAAAAEHLGLQPGAAAEGAQGAAAIPFSRLKMTCELTGPWLSLGGAADDEHPGVMLLQKEKPLLAAPPGHTVTTASLLRALLPDSRHLVPATRQTGGLVQWLPLPDVAPFASIQQTHTPTRLTPANDSERSAVRQPVLR